eukprot:TRINITY_DN53448_c0_g1_i1.p1 TRINITY_DN53448_c0_g1~~TRINITY_DN53448_c0_g1_i1.p1  ORF type:complete len:108 (+),score=13.30 TRINITY_DN53448_c0_g1_i1:194-517(+)
MSVRLLAIFLACYMLVVALKTLYPGPLIDWALTAANTSAICVLTWQVWGFAQIWFQGEDSGQENSSQEIDGPIRTKKTDSGWIDTTWELQDNHRLEWVSSEMQGWRH